MLLVAHAVDNFDMECYKQCERLCKEEGLYLAVMSTGNMAVQPPAQEHT